MIERVGIRANEGWYIFPTEDFTVKEHVGNSLAIETPLGRTLLENLVENPKDALIEAIEEGKQLIAIHRPGSGDDGTEGDGA